MLVLTRKQGQSITIGGSIVVTINHINGGRVAVGIEAPDEVNIRRSELEEFHDNGRDNSDERSI